MMRSCCQSSVMARRTADSVTSRPSACLQLRDGRVACFKLLVGLDRELRNLARAGQLRAAAPVAIAAKRIHVGQNPGRDHEIGLFAGLAKQVQPDCHAVRFKANQQLFSEATILAGSGVAFRSPATASTKIGAMEEENCRLGRKRHKPGLFDPRTGVLKGELPRVRSGASFRRAMLPIVPLSKKTSLPGWAITAQQPALLRAADPATFQVRVSK